MILRRAPLDRSGLLVPVPRQINWSNLWNDEGGVFRLVLKERFKEQPSFTCTEHVRALTAKGLGSADVGGQCGSAILGGGIASYGDTCYLRVRSCDKFVSEQPFINETNVLMCIVPSIGCSHQHDVGRIDTQNTDEASLHRQDHHIQDRHTRKFIESDHSAMLKLSFSLHLWNIP